LRRWHGLKARTSLAADEEHKAAFILQAPRESVSRCPI